MGNRHDLARGPQQRGIAAFVLKYRVVVKVGEDGIQALKAVRQHAAEWGVDPGKIGFLGFSAGGMVASAALLQDSAALRPAFVGLIYGAPFGVMPRIPAQLPPIFMAWAQDDPVALDFITRFVAALHSAGVQPDEHVYASGGHGFGMEHQDRE